MTKREKVSMNQATKVEPFLRWAGGKRKLTPLIQAMLPKDFNFENNRFFEPFAGSAAVTISLARENMQTSQSKKPTIFLSDLNDELINAFLVLKKNPEELIQKLQKPPYRNSEEVFYKIRSQTPSDPITRAARLIYLNRTCFNGLYRENSDGKFNVPYGHLANPVICNEPLLRAVSQCLSQVHISRKSFLSAIKSARVGDVIYLDPPYIPLSPTSSFSKYDASDFNEASHEALASAIRPLEERGVRVILSNSDCARTRRIYASCKLRMRTVRVRRNISAKGTSRIRVRELLAFNYPLSECRDRSMVEGLTKSS